MLTLLNDDNTYGKTILYRQKLSSERKNRRKQPWNIRKLVPDNYIDLLTD